MEGILFGHVNKTDIKKNIKFNQNMPLIYVSLGITGPGLCG